jgi:hypothetical protein
VSSLRRIKGSVEEVRHSLTAMLILTMYHKRLFAGTCFAPFGVDIAWAR